MLQRLSLGRGIETRSASCPNRWRLVQRCKGCPSVEGLKLKSLTDGIDSDTRCKGCPSVEGLKLGFNLNKSRCIISTVAKAVPWQGVEIQPLPSAFPHLKIL